LKKVFSGAASKGLFQEVWFPLSVISLSSLVRESRGCHCDRGYKPT